MTNTPFDRFKIFFKLKNVPKNYSYKHFQQVTNNDIKNYYFNTEDIASILGDGKFGQELIIPNFFKNLLEVELENYQNFFINQKGNIFLENREYENKTYENLLIELFEKRTEDQRVLYNDLFVSKKEINIFNYKNYDINKKFFIKIFINVIKKNNYNF